MTRLINKKITKKIAAMFMAVLMTFTGVLSAPVSAYNMVSVISVPCYNLYEVDGYPNYRASDTFTIASGDSKLTIAVMVTGISGDPTSSHVVLQELKLFGWASIASEWVPADRESRVIWSGIDTSEGKRYRLVCSCTPGADTSTSWVEISAAFVSWRRNP